MAKSSVRNNDVVLLLTQLPRRTIGLGEFYCRCGKHPVYSLEGSLTSYMTCCFRSMKLGRAFSSQRGLSLLDALLEETLQSDRVIWSHEITTSVIQLSPLISCCSASRIFSPCLFFFFNGPSVQFKHLWVCSLLSPPNLLWPFAFSLEEFSVFVCVSYGFSQSVLFYVLINWTQRTWTGGPLQGLCVMLHCWSIFHRLRFSTNKNNVQSILRASDH